MQRETNASIFPKDYDTNVKKVNHTYFCLRYNTTTKKLSFSFILMCLYYLIMEFFVHCNFCKNMCDDMEFVRSARTPPSNH